MFLPAMRAQAGVCPATLAGGALYVHGTTAADTVELRMDTTESPDEVDCRIAGGSFVSVAPVTSFSRIVVHGEDASDTLILGDAFFPAEDLYIPIFSSAFELIDVNAASSSLVHQVSVSAQKVAFASGFALEFSGVDAMSIELGSNTDDVAVHFPITASPLTITPGGGTNTLLADGTLGSDLIDVEASLVRFNDGDGLINFTAISSLTLDGGPGNDRLKGGPLPDLILGQGGNDKLTGRGGADSLEGGPGRDRCRGGSGKDTFTSCEDKIQ
jgi:Ca2+-binding RTX toxin-like protein